MAIPYQPSYTIQPTHGFRYGAQPHVNNVAPNYQVPAYEAPPKSISDSTPTKNKTLDTVKNVVSNFEGNEDIDNSASVQRSLDAAQNYFDEDITDPGIGGRPVYNPEFSFGALMPIGMGSGPVSPTTGFGSPGSVSGITGGVFDDKGRSVDQLTGYANPEFANAASFRSYMLTDPLGTKDKPLPNILGDRDNQFNYARDETGDRTKTSASEYEFAMANSPALKAAGGNLTEREKVKNDIVLKIAEDKGFTNPSKATLDAIKGENYDPITGAAPPGSQFSSTGKFQNKTYYDIHGQAQTMPDGSQTGEETSLTDTTGKTDKGQQKDLSSTYADDTASSPSGGK